MHLCLENDKRNNKHSNKHPQRIKLNSFSFAEVISERLTVCGLTGGALKGLFGVLLLIWSWHWLSWRTWRRKWREAHQLDNRQTGSISGEIILSSLTACHHCFNRDGGNLSVRVFAPGLDLVGRPAVKFKFTSCERKNNSHSKICLHHSTFQAIVYDSHKKNVPGCCT